jgi:hypothetical protein
MTRQSNVHKFWSAAVVIVVVVGFLAAAGVSVAVGVLIGSMLGF